MSARKMKQPAALHRRELEEGSGIFPGSQPSSQWAQLRGLRPPPGSQASSPVPLLNSRRLELRKGGQNPF